MEKVKIVDNLLSKVAADFIGLDTVYKTTDGKKAAAFIWIPPLPH